MSNEHRIKGLYYAVSQLAEHVSKVVKTIDSATHFQDSGYLGSDDLLEYRHAIRQIDSLSEFCKSSANMVTEPMVSGYNHNQTVYLTLMRPYLEVTRESYVVGVYTDLDLATQEGQTEAMHRAGKYESEVLEIPVQTVTSRTTTPSDPIYPDLDEKTLVYTARDSRESLWRKMFELADQQRKLALEGLAGQSAWLSTLKEMLGDVSSLPEAVRYHLETAPCPLDLSWVSKCTYTVHTPEKIEWGLSSLALSDEGEWQISGWNRARANENILVKPEELQNVR